MTDEYILFLWSLMPNEWTKRQKNLFWDKNIARQCYFHHGQELLDTIKREVKYANEFISEL